MSLLRTSRRPVSQNHGRRFLLGIGLAVVALACLAVWLAYEAPNSVPLRSYYTLTAEFADADNVAPHSQVRMRGKLVGQVLHPHARGNVGLVELQLERGVRPLPADSRFLVRPRSPLGVRYVEIIPGRSRRGLPDGATVPLGQGGHTTQLADVFGTFDAHTRARASELMRELGTGFVGRGEDINVTVATAPRFLGDLGAAARGITDRGRALHRLVIASDQAATAADPVRRDIGEGFRPEADVFAALSRRPAALRGTLEEAPRTLDALARTGPRIGAMLDALGGLARAGTPTFRAAAPALDRTTGFLDAARPGVGDLQTVLVRARRAVPETLALTRTVDPVLRPLRAGLRAPLPILDELAPRRCDILNMLGGWADAMQRGYDGANVIRLLVIGSHESVGGQTAAGRLAPIAPDPYPAPCAAAGEEAGR